MPDLLIEFGCEELPASACREAIAQVPGLVQDALAAARLPECAVEVWVAPRRIALSVAGLPEQRDGRTVEVRGPAAQAAFVNDGQPSPAAAGFAKSKGVDVADLVVREIEGREFVVAIQEEPGADTADLVPELARAVLESIRFGKNMRWGDGEGLRFSRPVRWIVAKLDDRTIPFTLHGLDAGAVSQGHRFLGGPVEIDRAASYRDLLEGAGVVADHEAPRSRIVADLDEAAERAGGNWQDPGGKLEEVLFLVERPSVLVGSIDPGHLRLPEKVLVTAMQSHQRYFPLTNGDGTLMPVFLAVSNGDPACAETIARGNSDVLDARLQDAAFSFDRDLEAGLAQLNQRLERIVFHKRLGSMADKRDRLEALAAHIAHACGLSGPVVDHAVKAASLAKIDQGAILVAEFSDLQGEVAAEYAAREGVPADVCRAVREHYLPLGPDSPLPDGDVGAVVALAEKFDNLVGAFLVDEVPSGSRDPYGLRRAAAGIVRILRDRGWNVSHRPWVMQVAGDFAAQGADLAFDGEAVAGRIDEFLTDRLAFALAEESVSAEACAAAGGGVRDGIAATADWAHQIQEHRASPEFEAVWRAATRLDRIVARADGVGSAFASAGDPGEDALHTSVTAAGPDIEGAVGAADLAGALAAAQPLAAAVDRFFVDVMVNADDHSVRARRLALVREAAVLLGTIADFSKVTDQGSTS